MKKFRYSNLFLDALNLVLKYKYLWVLGLLAAFSGSANVNFNNSPSFSLSGSSSFSHLSNYLSEPSRLANSWNANSNRFMVATVSTLLLGIALWIIGFIGQAALIKAAETLKRNGNMTLREALRNGVQSLAPMIGVAVLLYVPYYLASTLIGRAMAKSIANDITAFPTIPFALSLLILFPLGVLVSAIHPLAQQGIVIDRLGIVPSIINGWQFFWRNFRKLIFIVLVLALLLVIYTGIMSAVLLPLAGGTVFPALFALVETGNISIGQVLSIVGFSIVGVALNAPINAFVSVVITLTYCNLSEDNRKRQKK